MTDRSSLYAVTHPIPTDNIFNKNNNKKSLNNNKKQQIVCSVLRPHQHSIGYMGDGFYRSEDPTNSIKVPKEMLHKRNKKQQKNN